jgi:hypothetical protein
MPMSSITISSAPVILAVVLATDPSTVVSRPGPHPRSPTGPVVPTSSANVQDRPVPRTGVQRVPQQLGNDVVSGPRLGHVGGFAHEPEHYPRCTQRVRRTRERSRRLPRCPVLALASPRPDQSTRPQVFPPADRLTEQSGARPQPPVELFRKGVPGVVLVMGIYAEQRSRVRDTSRVRPLLYGSPHRSRQSKPPRRARSVRNQQLQPRNRIDGHQLIGTSYPDHLKRSIALRRRMRRLAGRGRAFLQTGRVGAVVQRRPATHAEVGRVPDRTVARSVHRAGGGAGVPAWKSATGPAAPAPADPGVRMAVVPGFRARW